MNARAMPTKRLRFSGDWERKKHGWLPLSRNACEEASFLRHAASLFYASEAVYVAMPAKRLCFFGSEMADQKGDYNAYEEASFLRLAQLWATSNAFEEASFLRLGWWLNELITAVDRGEFYFASYALSMVYILACDRPPAVAPWQWYYRTSDDVRREFDMIP